MIIVSTIWWLMNVELLCRIEPHRISLGANMGRGSVAYLPARYPLNMEVSISSCLFHSIAYPAIESLLRDESGCVATIVAKSGL